MTIDRLRAAFTRTFRDYGLNPRADFLDELVSIADHHAAEESAAAFAQGTAAGAERKGAA